MSLVPDGGAGGEGSTATLRESPCMVKVVFALKLSFTVPSALLTVAGDSSTLRLRLKGEGAPSSETVMEVRPVGEGWGEGCGDGDGGGGGGDGGGGGGGGAGVEPLPTDKLSSVMAPELKV